MMMNYHELTMNEPRDSPARRQQFLVICTVMAGAMIYSTATAGGFSPVQVQVGEFLGGEYVYKHSKRDYAAAGGLARAIGADLGLKQKQHADVMYNIYLDNPAVVASGREQRFASGLLIKQDDEEGEAKKNGLMSKNEFIVPFTEQEFSELSAKDLWEKIKYESKVLPKTKAAVVHFPFTDGFVSALILSWKIIPALHKYVQENSDSEGSPVVVSTCSVEDQMCTHYAPLAEGGAFLLGQEDSKVYAASLEPAKLIDLKAAMTVVKKMLPFYKYFGSSKGGDEL